MRAFIPGGTVGAFVQLFPLFIGLNALSQAFMSPSISDDELILWSVIAVTFSLLIFDSVREYTEFDFDELNSLEQISMLLYTGSLSFYGLSISRYFATHDYVYIGWMSLALAISSIFEILFSLIYFWTYSNKKDPRFERSDYWQFALVEVFFVFIYIGLFYGVVYHQNHDGNEYIWVYGSIVALLVLVCCERGVWLLLKHTQSTNASGA